MYLVKYTIKRLVMLIPVILGVTLILYFVMSLAPGNPARQILGADATAEQVAALEHEMGLDKPIIVQYINYILGVVRLDFGTSWVTGLEVLESFRQRLPDTFFLALCSTLWAVALGIPLGIASAVKQYSLLDYGFMLLAMLLFSFPPFWLALLCQLLFCLTLGWLPATGVGSLSHFILPALVLGANTLASMIRMSRTSMLDVLRQDYIRTARSKGQTEWVVITKHALKNALIPIITVAGLQFGGLLGGSVLTETIFSIPGIGTLMVGAIKQRNGPVVQGAVLFTAVVFSFINLGVDILYSFVDPRIRSQYKSKPKAAKAGEISE